MSKVDFNRYDPGDGELSKTLNTMSMKVFTLTALDEIIESIADAETWGSFIFCVRQIILQIAGARLLHTGEPGASAKGKLLFGSGKVHHFVFS